LYLFPPRLFTMKKKKRIEIGEFAMIPNTTARQGANARYMYGVVRERRNGESQWCERHLMLTVREYSNAMDRALKNPEDCIERHTVIRPRKREKGFMAWLKRRGK